MNTIQGEIVNELEITKSRFITYLKHTTSVVDAKDYISYVKSIHKDATHHVVCTTIGKTGEYGQANDDGEPSGTAGLPALDVFRKNDITNFVCVIVRYFGGVKLGAGGLVRAYSKSASEALKKIKVVPIIDYSGLQITFDYSFMNLIENRLQNYEIINKSFNTNVTFTLKVPTNELNKVINLLIALTNNLIKIKVLTNDEENASD